MVEIRFRLLPRPRRDVRAEAEALVSAGGGAIPGGDTALLDEVIDYLGERGILDAAEFVRREPAIDRDVSFTGREARTLRFDLGQDMFREEG